MSQLYLPNSICLLYTSDAADDMQCVDLGGRRIIKKYIRASVDLRGYVLGSGQYKSPADRRRSFFKQKTAYEM